MKITTTLTVALLLLGAQGPLQADNATAAEKKVVHERKGLKNAEKSLDEERDERNADVKDLRHDSVKKANDETELHKDKLQGNADDMKQDKKDIKRDEKAIKSDKKDLAASQVDVNKAKGKVRKSARRLHKAKVAQKVEEAKP